MYFNQQIQALDEAAYKLAQFDRLWDMYADEVLAEYGIFHPTQDEIRELTRLVAEYQR